MKKIIFIFSLFCLGLGLFSFSSQQEYKSTQQTNLKEKLIERKVSSIGDGYKTSLNRTIPSDKKIKIIKEIHHSKDQVIDRSNLYKKSRSHSLSSSARRFSLKGQELYILENHSAINKNQYNSRMGRKISSIRDYIIFKGKTGLPVVQDPIKFIRGHATGNIIVKAKPTADLRQLALDYDLEVEYSLPHLNLISFVPRDKSKLLEISAKLSASSLLDEVRLDISYGGPHAK